MTQKRAIFYIDGLNFYNLVLKSNRHYRWLNLKALADRIVHEDTTVVCVKYFTARLLGEISESAKENQSLYFRALKPIDDIEIMLGNMVIREKSVALTTAEQSKLKRRQVLANIPEEKGTDVNLASHLIYDACNDEFDIAYVISNDTDFVEPIRMVKEDIGKTIVVVAPHRSLVDEKKKRNRVPIPDTKLERAASDVYYIKDSLFIDSQFSDEIRTNAGKIITKPRNWR